MSIWNESTVGIEKLNLSNRSYNCLKRNGVKTIKQLMILPEEKLLKFKNLGVKSFGEIKNIITKVSQGNFIIEETPNNDNVDNLDLKSQFDCKIIDCVTNNELAVSKIMFYNNHGILCEDLNVEDMELSVRSKKCLLGNGYLYVSQLLDLKKSEFIVIKNMGNKSITEVLNKIVDSIYVVYKEETNNSLEYEAYCNQIIDDYNNCSIKCDRGVVKSNIYLLLKKNKAFFSNYVNDEGEKLSKNIHIPQVLELFYTDSFFRQIIKAHIYTTISLLNKLVSVHYIKQILPEHLKHSEVGNSIILEMIEEKKLELVDGNLRYWHPTLIDYIDSLENERNKIVLFNRLSGKTLEETGSQLKITRERIRQIEKKVLNKRPRLREDDYKDVFEKYEWDLETFITVYSENELTFRYLKTIYETGSNSLEQFLLDEEICKTVRLRAEKIIYKDYIIVGASRIKRERNEILDYILRTHCRNETTSQELYELYNKFLDNFCFSEMKEMMYSNRYFETTLANSKKVLWKFGKRLRYYNFESINASQIITALNLEQYHDVEYSTLKFFRQYPEMMEEWDIRDEYELHNLIKKMVSEDFKLNINLRKMPNIEFGTADRDMQVLNLLLQETQIGNVELAKLYEDEYGVKSETALANHFKCIDEYYHNGVYSIETETLMGEQFNFMKNALKKEFYFISDVKEIYHNMYPNGDVTLISAYNLKRLGFRVNSNNIYSDKYTNGEQYFREIFLKNDIFDASILDTRISCNQTYYHVQQSLREKYEILEFVPNKFVNIRRLEQIGVGKDDLRAFSEAIFEFVDEEFFTIQSLRKRGFEHKLYELGFEDWFYASLLKCDARFKYRRVEGNFLFKKGTEVVTINSLIEYLVYHFRNIDIYDLVQFIFDNYGIKVERYKIPGIIHESEIYYDAIMEKIYIDYDEYFEEV